MNVIELRKNDIFCCNEFEDEIKGSFPSELGELVNGLSNVTAAFYGITMDLIGDNFGKDKIDLISSSLNYRIGKMKAMDYQSNIGMEDRGTINVIEIIIYSIFSASPDFVFNVKKLSKEESSIEITGIDRYYKVCKELNIDQYIQWPAQRQFLKGIIDQLENNFEFISDLVYMKETGETKCIYTIINRNNG
ncbi:hypothetical protein [uncultured Cytophaga sp.]|uniref:hypothetical protein n=1 Tax=uncultured Cytophaga sp. TaxID=160238 RepID=UPI002604983E|nr:hypothetical protein [uncultured Cytophaga sp.]